MNVQANHRDSSDELVGDLRAVVDHMKNRPIPESSLQQALEQTRRLAPTPTFYFRRMFVRSLVGVATAVAACLAFGFWVTRPASAWAEVAKAVQTKPWIHGVVRDAKPGRFSEFWFSTSRAVGGCRAADETVFFDDKLQIVFRYDPTKDVIQRLPASDEVSEGQQFLKTLQGLFRGDEELNARQRGLVLKEQKRRQIEKEGRKVDMYELVYSIPTQPDVGVRQTFFVDIQTRLPTSMTMKLGVTPPVEVVFDFPETGPADIYALGAPRNAQVIDRVPTGDLSRILAAQKAGQERFDDFHGIVIRNNSPELVAKAGQEFPMAYVVWKKGARWRVEVGIATELLKPMPANKDKREWVREVCQKTHFTVVNVCDEKAVYDRNLKVMASADQAHTMAYATRAMPTSWAYPVTFPAPNQITEETMNVNPTDGPPSTILVTSRVLKPGPNTIPVQHFWVDPKLGYGVVRHDLRNTDPTKPPTKGDYQNFMQQWEKSPSGTWYPTLVQAGSFGSHWFHYFLDFQVDLPDELFKPATRTILTAEYPVSF